METTKKTTILIAAAHALLNEGLSILLKANNEFEIVGSATNDFQTIDLSGNLKPDILLLDMSILEINGCEFISLIKQKSANTKILILNVEEDESLILESLKAGAKGYLSKHSRTPDLFKAMKVISCNELWLERKMMCRFFNEDFALLNDKSNRHVDDKKHSQLSPREKEVLQFLAKGCSNKEIAQCLIISEKTVKTHLNKIFKKLKVNRRLEAILLSIKSGLV